MYALSAAVGFVVIGATAFGFLEPRPTRLAITTRTGDDTIVVNQLHPTRLGVTVMDQYARPMRSDSTVRYQWTGGDSIGLSSAGSLQCKRPSESSVRAAFAKLSRAFVLRCRPVVAIEAATWIDLMVGDSARDLTFVAHGPDGRRVTELRGSVTLHDSSVVGIEGTAIRPKHAGATFATVEVGDARASIPIMVYQDVTSFADNRKLPLMAMRVSLAQGDTIRSALPKAAFWVTYFSRERGAAPPTIEIVGAGSCSLGDGLNVRRIEDDEYAKYCHTETGDQMMIAHGASGAAVVRGVVAVRVMW